MGPSSPRVEAAGRQKLRTVEARMSMVLVLQPSVRNPCSATEGAVTDRSWVLCVGVGAIRTQRVIEQLRSFST